MEFNKEIWKSKLPAQLSNLRLKAGDWGVNSIYGLCLAATLWPAMDALQIGDMSAMLGVGAAIGTSLISKHLESLKSKPKEKQPDYLAELLEKDEALRKDAQKLMEELESLPVAVAESKAEDRAWLEERLNQELGQWGGGIRIEGNVRQSIINTGSQNTFTVTFVDKQEIINYHFSTPTAAENKAEQEQQNRILYLKQLYKHCQNLLLDPLGEDPTAGASVHLNDVYIELNTKTPKKGKKAKPEKINNDEFSNLFNEKDAQLTAMEAARKHDHLVILGDPGSGKSAFAKRLLGLLAEAEFKETKALPGFKKGLLPVLVNLRDLIPFLKDLDIPENGEERKRLLAEEVLKQAQNDLKNIYFTPDFAEGMCKAITSGECFLILDGLDEVPQDKRYIVREVAAGLMSCYHLQRLLVTCRIRSYQGDAVLQAFSAHILAPLTRDQIKKFTQDWYQKQSILGRVKPTEWQNKATDLASAATGDEKMLELAENPMLLTSMAIVHQRDTKLPPERVKLFKEVVKILLLRWQEHRGNQQLSERLITFLKNEDKVWRAMEELAFEAHRIGKGNKEAADLERRQARDILEEHHLFSADLAAEFLDHIDQRSGILIGRGGELGKPLSYTFPHRIFQEYLAGCYLASQPDIYSLIDLFREIAEEGDFWDVAALLAFEELKFNRPSAALQSLAFELRKENPLQTCCDQRLILWSGQIGVLIGWGEIKNTGRRGEYYINKLKPELFKTACDIQLNPVERAETADILDGLGYIPDDLYKFVKIEGDKKTPEFWMGKYPVTNLQYERFLTEENFRNETLWCNFPDYVHKGYLIGDTGKEGWLWLQKELKDTNYGILYPKTWRSLHFGKTRRTVPVVGICWYEAYAYCRWVLNHWASLEEGKENKNPEPEQIRLPLDTEWKKACGGFDNERFPWETSGEKSDQEKILQSANTVEAGIGKTTPVWMYPQGKSQPYALYDLAGNVWEWQALRYDEETGLRVLRGGSFGFDQDFARCAFRYRGSPSGRVNIVGFRLCLSPSSVLNL